MGACGCGDGGPDFKLAGPEGKWIGVTIYPGCDDCETPVAVEFDRLDGFPQEVIDAAPELKFSDWGVVAIEVLDAERLKEKLESTWLGGSLEEEVDMTARDLRRVLRLAVRGKVIK